MGMTMASPLIYLFDAKIQVRRCRYRDGGAQGRFHPNRGDCKYDECFHSSFFRLRQATARQAVLEDYARNCVVASSFHICLPCPRHAFSTETLVAFTSA